MRDRGNLLVGWRAAHQLACLDNYRPAKVHHRRPCGYRTPRPPGTRGGKQQQAGIKYRHCLPIMNPQPRRPFTVGGMASWPSPSWWRYRRASPICSNEARPGSWPRFLLSQSPVIITLYSEEQVPPDEMNRLRRSPIAELGGVGAFVQLIRCGLGESHISQRHDIRIPCLASIQGHARHVPHNTDGHGKIGRRIKFSFPLR